MRERSVHRVLVDIGGSTYVLAPSEDPDALCERIEAAATSEGTFVRFATADGRVVRALITPRSRVTIIEEDVVLDADEAVLSLNESGNWDLL